MGKKNRKKSVFDSDNEILLWTIPFSYKYSVWHLRSIWQGVISLVKNQHYNSWRKFCFVNNGWYVLIWKKPQTLLCEQSYWTTLFKAYLRTIVKALVLSLLVCSFFIEKGYHKVSCVRPIANPLLQQNRIVICKRNSMYYIHSKDCQWFHKRKIGASRGLFCTFVTMWKKLGLPGVFLGSSWELPGVFLGSSWGLPGVFLGSSFSDIIDGLHCRLKLLHYNALIKRKLRLYSMHFAIMKVYS